MMSRILSCVAILMIIELATASFTAQQATCVRKTLALYLSKGYSNYVAMEVTEDTDTEINFHKFGAQELSTITGYLGCAAADCDTKTKAVKWIKTHLGHTPTQNDIVTRDETTVPTGWSNDQIHTMASMKRHSGLDVEGPCFGYAVYTGSGFSNDHCIGETMRCDAATQVNSCCENMGCFAKMKDGSKVKFKKCRSFCPQGWDCTATTTIQSPPPTPSPTDTPAPPAPAPNGNVGGAMAECTPGLGITCATGLKCWQKDAYSHYCWDETLCPAGWMDPDPSCSCSQLNDKCQVGGCCAGLQCFKKSHKVQKCKPWNHCPNGYICPGHVTNASTIDMSGNDHEPLTFANAATEDIDTGDDSTDTDATGCKGYNKACYGPKWGNDGPCCDKFKCFQKNEKKWKCRTKCPKRWKCNAPVSDPTALVGVIDEVSYIKGTREFEEAEEQETTSNTEGLLLAAGAGGAMFICLLVLIWAGIYAICIELARRAAVLAAGRGRSKTQRMRTCFRFARHAAKDAADRQDLEDPAFDTPDDRASDEVEAYRMEPTASEVMSKFDEQAAHRRQEEEAEEAKKRAALKKKLEDRKKAKKDRP